MGPSEHNRHVLLRDGPIDPTRGHVLLDGSELTAAEVEWGRALHTRKVRPSRTRLDGADLLDVLARCGYSRPPPPALPGEVDAALRLATARKRSRHRPRVRCAFLMASEVLGVLLDVFGFARGAT